MRNSLKGCGSCALFVVTTYIVYYISFPIFLEQLDPEGDTQSDNRLQHKSERSYRGRHIICHHFQGGIGDQLFQYASLLAIAEQQHRILISKGGNSILENFIIDLQILPGSSHCDDVIKVVENFCCRDDDRFTKLDANKNYDFEGFLQSWQYFKNNNRLIHKYIIFQRPIIEKAKEAIDTVLESKGLSRGKISLVGIHVKRGDRMKEPHVTNGYRVAPKEYFRNAMNYLKNHAKKPPVFLLISQDVEWCKENIMGDPNVIFVPPLEAEVELAMFTWVEHAIISVGSFTWWAGHFTKGKVIYYNRPVAPDSKVMTEYGGVLSKAFKSSWIGME